MWGIGYNSQDLDDRERREDESRRLGAKGIVGIK